MFKYFSKFRKQNCYINCKKKKIYRQIWDFIFSLGHTKNLGLQNFHTKTNNSFSRPKHKNGPTTLNNYEALSHKINLAYNKFEFFWIFGIFKNFLVFYFYVRLIVHFNVQRYLHYLITRMNFHNFESSWPKGCDFEINKMKWRMRDDWKV